MQSVKTNKKGIAVFKFKKSTNKEKKEIVVEGEYLDKLNFSINLNKNYYIKAFMSKSSSQGFHHSRAIKHQIIAYKIIDFSEKSIELKRNGETLLLKKTQK